MPHDSEHQGQTYEPEYHDTAYERPEAPAFTCWIVPEHREPPAQRAYLQKATKGPYLEASHLQIVSIDDFLEQITPFRNVRSEQGNGDKG